MRTGPQAASCTSLPRCGTAFERASPGKRDRSYAAGAAVLAVAMGFGRFAYTPLLVVMQHDAKLSVAFAGVLASINLAGYLCGALLAMHSSIRARRYRVLRAAAIGVAIGTAMMALPASWWAVARFLTGVASGLAFVLAVSLLLDRFSRIASTLGLALLFSGVGIGIASAGILVPALASLGGSRMAWLGIAGICLLILGVALPQLGDEPLSTVRSPAPAGAVKRGAFGRLSAAYGLEGAAYIIPATFLVAMVNEAPGLARFSSLTWVAVGIVAAPAAAFWGAVARRIGKAEGLLVAMGLQTLGMLAPLVLPGLAGVSITAVTLGGTFVGITSLASELARELRPAETNVAIGKLTVIYGIGQIVGPLIAVRISLATGHYRDALLFAAAILACGTVVFGASVLGDRYRRE